MTVLISLESVELFGTCHVAQTILSGLLIVTQMFVVIWLMLGHTDHVGYLVYLLPLKTCGLSGASHVIQTVFTWLVLCHSHLVDYLYFLCI